MDWLLIAARAVHYAATISLAGVFAFCALVLGSGASPRLRWRLSLLAWASLLLALVSGALWLWSLAANLGGRSLNAALTQGVVATVLTDTRFGRLWFLRLFLAVLLSGLSMLPQAQRGRLWRWTGLALAAAMLGSLAWAGHGGATPGIAGDLHFAADILHLLAAGAWLGGLVPLALLLAEYREAADADAALARRAVSRFSRVAAGSVAVLLSAGLVITWFLAGSVPALIGTTYGRLLLAKIALFLTMVFVGAINLLRLSPRLVPSARSGSASAAAAPGQLRRNALIEAGLGLAVLGIVAVLGTLPPGLHTEPRWPLPFRFELAGLTGLAKLGLALLTALAIFSAVAAAASAARGCWHRAGAAGGGLAAAIGLGALLLRPAAEPAYPTSFFAPTEPYAAAVIARGARLYAENCAVCHGADGKGDGPAAAALRVRPADLTAQHLFTHSDGDLYWWIGHGRDAGVMPGFAGVLRPAERWAVIDFVRARAAGLLSRKVGPQLSTGVAPAVPDFAFVADGSQQTLDRLLKTGPALLVLLGASPPPARLARLAAAHEQLAMAGLPLVAVAVAPLARRLPEGLPAPEIYAPPPDVAAALALFRDPGDGGETDLLLDRAGRVRARWIATDPGGLPDAALIAADAAQAARLPRPPETHAGHAH